MSAALWILVRWHDARYHGADDWPPSPARLFQALVAGAGLAGRLGEAEEAALGWLESQDPPRIVAPAATLGQRVTAYLPNNDKPGTDPRGFVVKRDAKLTAPRLLEAGAVVAYGWGVPDDARHHAAILTALAEGVFQLGRGVDMAWAEAALYDPDAEAALLAALPGTLHRPSPAGELTPLLCPQPGSLASLKARHAAGSRRFETVTEGKKSSTVFVQAPRPRFRRVEYGVSVDRRLYALVAPEAPERMQAVALTAVGALVPRLRDAVATRLMDAMPDKRDAVLGAVVGKVPDGAPRVAAEDRVRMVALPSIGMRHVDRAVRRVLVDVPARAPIAGDDVHWAVLHHADDSLRLVPLPAEDAMAAHYGVGYEHRARHWQTVTPVALPAPRDGDDPRTAAQHALRQALRHAEIRTAARITAVQREPFEAHGAPAGDFAAGTRFASARLWHASLEFAAPVEGPLLLGDGRFYGLGLFAPVQEAARVLAWRAEGQSPGAEPEEICRALHRALLACVQRAVTPGEAIPAMLSGHRDDGGPARAQVEGEHVRLVFDPVRSRLLVLSPTVGTDAVPTSAERAAWPLLVRALADMTTLRAGAAGCLSLTPLPFAAAHDPLWGTSRVWASLTRYRVTRHRKAGDARQALADDVRAECVARGLPTPEAVEVESVSAARGRGLMGQLRLTFARPVRGPLLLGASRYRGGGVFGPVDEG